MSQTQHLFSANAKVTTLQLGAAPATKQLANSGNTVRIVNTSMTDNGYVTFGDTQAGTVAALPVDGSATSCYVGPAADFTMSIPGMPGDTPKYVSGISAGSPLMLFYVGSGS